METTQKALNVIFSERLKDLRKKHKMTQAETAARLGIPRTTYSGYEKCIREARYSVLVNLAELFDVSIDYLLGLTQEPKPKKNRNLDVFLQQEGLHWNGVPLDEKKIKPIREFFKTFINIRIQV